MSRQGLASRPIRSINGYGSASRHHPNGLCRGSQCRDAVEDESDKLSLAGGTRLGEDILQMHAGRIEGNALASGYVGNRMSMGKRAGDACLRWR